MKKNLFFLILLAVTLNGFAQRPNRYKPRVFNWGVKVGLEAMSMNHYEVFSEETELSKVSYKNRSGFYVNTFTRINLKRFFVQPGIEWSLSKQGLFFTTLSEQKVEISHQSQNVVLNGLLGYNIVQNGPFILNLIAGPAFYFNYKNEYRLSPELSLPDNIMYSYLYGMVGFSINIARMHFDVRYKINFFNTDIDFEDMPNRPEILDGIIIRKTENLVGFSCGFMF
ncbi:hypothetical protein AGMMS50262_20200 [Bacteroidia bacterium]|nr:hypothetical protein AGMMS50262_20200 [Bacteroidia bacterium]